METEKDKKIENMLRENEYMRNAYEDELEVAKGKELNNASSPEERQKIGDTYSLKKEENTARYETFKAVPDYAEDTEQKIEELRDSYKKYEDGDEIEKNKQQFFIN